jgi:beta-1,4-mannosyltransferase
MSNQQRELRISSSEAIDLDNPYLRLFYRALERYGVTATGPFDACPSWLRAHDTEFDALHVHWPEFIMWRKISWECKIDGFRGSWRLRRLLESRRLRRLLRSFAPWGNISPYRRFLREAKDRGKWIIWTCHNLRPHESPSGPVLEAIRLVATSANLIICHDSRTRDLCRQYYSPAGQIVIMPFGNYDGAYPPPRPRPDVRREWNINESRPLLVCLGPIRPYKGIELACQAASALGERVSLLVAGHVATPEYARRIRRLAVPLRNVIIVDRTLTDQEFADLMGASDIVLLPYRSLTGSSALLAALTFGRGVITSDLPFFTSMLSNNPLAGRTFRSGDAGSLVEAISTYLTVPPEVRQRAARSLADAFDWSLVIRPVATALRGLSGNV